MLESQMNARNCGQQPCNGYRPPEHKNIFCVCSTKVIFIWAVLLAATLGLIFGAVFAAVILLALPALIIAAVTFAVIVISLIVLKYCICCRPRSCM